MTEPLTTSDAAPRRALDQVAPETARPRRRRRDWRLAVRAADPRTRRPAEENLLLVGPGGVPVWTKLSRP